MKRASKAFSEAPQPVDPQIAELNRELMDSPPPRRGAPLGNQNRWLHGKFTAERRAFMAEVRAHVRHGNWLARQFRALEPVTITGRRASYRGIQIVERIP